MVNHTLDELRVLASAYVEATGVSKTGLSKTITGNPHNDKLIVSLLSGKSCLMQQGEAASRFFRANWPPGVPWPLADNPPCQQRTAAE